MAAPVLTSVKRFLRSPRLIISELAGLAVACAIGATLPQRGSDGPIGADWWAAQGPAVLKAGHVLALDHVFRSVWFLALCATATASLTVVIYMQFRRLRVLWSRRLSEGHFRTAPFQAEFERLARAPSGTTTPQVEVWSERRIGLGGSLVLHSGLLCIVLAGALRALLASDAVADLVETETLAAGPEAWSAQFPGLLARPFSLDQPLTLKAVHTARYDGGELRDLWLTLSVPGGATETEHTLGINRELRVAGGRIFLSSDHGPAALLEWQCGTAAPILERVDLAERRRGRFEGRSEGASGLVAHLRAQASAVDARPEALDVRVMRDRALVQGGTLKPDETMSLPGGDTLTLHGLPFWARLRGTRDPALGLALAGLTLILFGSATMFLLVKVDACIVVTPMGDREHVFVALRPDRLAPMYRERFERLLREQGAPA
jgi:hypothetical protein